MTAADVLRVVAIVETAAVMGGIVEPILGQAARSWRVWLLIVTVEGFMFSCAMAVVSHFGSPGVAWYRTPLVIVFGTCGVVYLAIYRRDVRRGQRLARNLNSR